MNNWKAVGIPPSPVAYKGKLFKTKADAEKYFNKLPYKSQKNQKIVKAVI